MDDDNDGYARAGVDHDAKYFRGAHVAFGLVAAAVAMAGGFPQVRDWIWGMTHPAAVAAAAAQRRSVDQAAIKADLDKILVTMRQCNDRAVVYGNEPCRDGSQGVLVMDQRVKR